MRTYSPTEFLANLSQDELPDPTEVAIAGLVRADEKTPSVIYYSNSLSCEKWLSIPIEIIESIDHLRTVACKDHQHPLVKIKFKRPDEARQDLAFFLNLLSRLQDFIVRSQSAARTGTPTRLRDGIGGDCAIVSTPDSLDICCVEGDDDNLEVVCYQL